MLTKEEGLLGFRTRALSGVSLNLKQPRLGELGPEAAQELLLLGLGVGGIHSDGSSQLYSQGQCPVSSRSQRAYCLGWPPAPYPHQL